LQLVLLAAGILLCVCFAAANGRYFSENPMNKEFSLDYPSASAVGENGDIYVIDKSKQRIASFTKDGVYRFQILGGSRNETSFYSADNLKVDNEGNVYVVDVVLSLDGSEIEKERIVKFDREGTYVSTVYEKLYEEGTGPLITGRIQGLTLLSDGVEFIYNEADCLSLMKVTFADLAVETVKSIPYDTQYLISFAIDKNTNQIYGVTKMAEIMEICDDGTERSIYKGEDHDTDEFFSIPWRIAVDLEGYLYFTDIGLRNIGYVTPEGETGLVIQRADPENLGNNRIFYSLDVSDSRVVTSVASTDVYTAQFDGSDVPVTTKYGIEENSIMLEYSGQYLAVRGMAFFSIFLILVFLLLWIRTFSKLKIQFHLTEMAKNNLIIVTVAVIIAAATGPSIMDSLQKQYRAQVMNNMSSVAELVCSSLDPEDVEAINTPLDYTGEAYGRVKDQIQASFSTTNGWNEGLYCVLNRVTDNHIIYSCLYLEDTIGSVYPLDYDYEGLEYQELYESGQEVRFDWIENTDGIWSYVLAPVFNEDGEVIAAMEVGTNLYAFEEANSAMVRSMVFNIISIVAIIILIFTELSFLWFYKGKRAQQIADSPDPAKKTRELAVYVIRPMIFLIFMADCMATAFLPMMANQLAVPMFGIPVEMMSAIPISMEVLMTAIFSFVGGFLLEKMGFRKMMIVGGTLFTAGLLAVGFSSSILPFIIAKAIIGIGVGLLLVSMNTLIASYPGQDSRDGFSFYNSGSLAGLTVGTTIGSFLVASLGYFKVYFVAAAVSVAVLWMVLKLFRKDTIYPELTRESEDEGGQKISIVQFLCRRELILFFGCAMIPYLLSGYFLNYFMPLFAEGQGMSEATIGQLFLINGICVIYLGPSLTSLLTGKLKLKYPVLIAGGIYIATLFLFFLFTGNGMVVGTALLFGIADSFGFSALSIYFSSLDAVKQFGSGKAMGVYSTFENAAQTMGPFVFSAVFVMGIRRGILLLAIVYLILLALYLLFGRQVKQEQE
ncbi:MAG: MFS transporter, partial [Lachnospiraceae bacterium]